VCDVGGGRSGRGAASADDLNSHYIKKDRLREMASGTTMLCNMDVNSVHRLQCFEVCMVVEVCGWEGNVGVSKMDGS
jgi:hypothetical protein